MRKKNVITKTMVGVGLSAVSLVFAQTALANSFTTTTQGGTASYNDGADQFCAQAYNSEGARTVRVQLTAISRPGPSKDFKDYNNYYGHPGATCVSLAAAYEDTQYRAIIDGYWGEVGTVQRKTVTFYS